MLDQIQNPLPEEEILPPKKFKLDEYFHTKTFNIGVLGIFGLLFLLIAASAFYYFLNINKNSTAIPAPTPILGSITPGPTKTPSKYATDSGVLKEMNSLDALENDLKNIDLNEKSLTFPAVDFNLNFDKSGF